MQTSTIYVGHALPPRGLLRRVDRALGRVGGLPLLARQASVHVVALELCGESFLWPEVLRGRGSRAVLAGLALRLATAFGSSHAIVTPRSGPGAGYRTIGTLPKGSQVHLQRCTRESNWCLFLGKDGEPAGWVRGSYLVGSGAKLEVTPYKFEGFDPLDPIKTCDDDDETSFFCW